MKHGEEAEEDSILISSEDIDDIQYLLLGMYTFLSMHKRGDMTNNDLLTMILGWFDAVTEGMDIPDNIAELSMVKVPDTDKMN